MKLPGKSTLLLLAGALVLLFGLLAWRASRPSGGVQRRLAELRAAGLPTTLAELDRWFGDVPPEQNGAPAILAALDQRTVDTSRSLPKRGESWTSNTLAWAVSQSEASAELRRQLHEALLHGRFRFSSPFTNGPANLQLDHLAKLKGAAFAFNLAAAHAAVRGDANEAVAALLDGFRLGQTLEAEPILISYLVHVAIEAIMLGGTEQVLSRLQLDAANLARLEGALVAALNTNGLCRALIGERAYGGDFFQMPPGQFARLMAAPAIPGGGNAGSGWDSLAASAFQHAYTLSGLRNRDFAFYLGRMDELIALAPQMNPEGRRRVKAFEVVVANTAAWKHVMTRQLLPALSRSHAKEIRHVAVTRCALTACAVERYRLAQGGRLPERLDELVPAFLPAVPEDPMDGRPLKFRRLTRGYVVYSVGDDDTDDGGIEPANRPKNGPGGWDYTFVVER